MNGLSPGAILAAILLVCALAIAHGGIYAKTRGRQRKAYPWVLAPVLIATAFIPFATNDTFGVLRVSLTYELLTLRSFYLAGGRDLAVDACVFGIPLVHQVVSILLAFAIVRHFVNEPGTGSRKASS